ncbi:MAG: DUF2778 domain-containing protein [Limnobacter sp.]|nr:DUF2778 domain-containing protein [Limnobacter sp.]
MLECSFRLNGEDLGMLRIDGYTFAAFSGFRQHVNQAASQCLPDAGPIPRGKYYVVDRATGILQKINAWLQSKNDWFALFAMDGKIDDFMTCDGIRRGNFRLHPMGEEGVSLGCVTLINRSDFDLVSSKLRDQKPLPVGDGGHLAYAILTVS